MIRKTVYKKCLSNEKAVDGATMGADTGHSDNFPEGSSSNICENVVKGKCFSFVVFFVYKEILRIFH